MFYFMKKKRESKISYCGWNKLQIIQFVFKGLEEIIKNNNKKKHLVFEVKFC
jgi:hypothetical protein